MAKVVLDLQGEEDGYMCLMNGGLRSTGESPGMEIIRPEGVFLVGHSADILTGPRIFLGVLKLTVRVNLLEKMGTTNLVV